MSRIIILVSSILMSAAAFSTMANAGSTITDKSYWPNEARQSIGSRPAASDPNSALAFDAPRAGAPREVQTDRAANSWRYQGGPKSR